MDQRHDGRLKPRNEPTVHITKMIGVPDPGHHFVEMTVPAIVKPADADGVKQSLLDQIGVLVGRQSDQPAVQPAE